MLVDVLGVTMLLDSLVLMAVEMELSNASIKVVGGAWPFSYTSVSIPHRVEDVRKDTELIAPRMGHKII